MPWPGVTGSRQGLKINQAGLLPPAGFAYVSLASYVCGAKTSTRTIPHFSVGGFGSPFIRVVLTVVVTTPSTYILRVTVLPAVPVTRTQASAAMNAPMPPGPPGTPVIVGSTLSTATSEYRWEISTPGMTSTGMFDPKSHT